MRHTILTAYRDVRGGHTDFGRRQEEEFGGIEQKVTGLEQLL